MHKLYQTILILTGLLTIHSGILAQESEERTFDDFQSLKITGKIKAELIPGDENKIYIESDEFELKKVSTEIEKEVLTIKMLSKIFQKPTAYVRVTYKKIESIEARADADIIFTEPIQQDTFKIESSSGANIKLDIETNQLDIKNFQGGQTLIKGKTNLLKAYVNTGGILSATDLNCDEVNIRLNTGGKAEMTVNQKITAKVNTMADLSYFGKPKEKEISTSLGGSVSAWDEEEQ
ncbi:MAG: head GIN domain-containing protein [Bacteroidales bacterium]